MKKRIAVFAAFFCAALAFLMFTIPFAVYAESAESSAQSATAVIVTAAVSESETISSQSVPETSHESAYESETEAETTRQASETHSLKKTTESSYPTIPHEDVNANEKKILLFTIVFAAVILIISAFVMYLSR